MEVKILAIVRKYGAEVHILKVHKAYVTEGNWQVACGAIFSGWKNTQLLEETSYTGPKSRICGNCWRFKMTVSV